MLNVLQFYNFGQYCYRCVFDMRKEFYKQVAQACLDLLGAIEGIVQENPNLDCLSTAATLSAGWSLECVIL